MSFIRRSMHHVVPINNFVAIIFVSRQRSSSADFRSNADCEDSHADTFSATSTKSIGPTTSTQHSVTGIYTPQSFPPTPRAKHAVLARGLAYTEDLLYRARDELRSLGLAAQQAAASTANGPEISPPAAIQRATLVPPPHSARLLTIPERQASVSNVNDSLQVSVSTVHGDVLNPSQHTIDGHAAADDDDDDAAPTPQTDFFPRSPSAHSVMSRSAISVTRSFVSGRADGASRHGRSHGHNGDAAMSPSSPSRSKRRSGRSGQPDRDADHHSAVRSRSGTRSTSTASASLSGSYTRTQLASSPGQAPLLDQHADGGGAGAARTQTQPEHAPQQQQSFQQYFEFFAAALAHMTPNQLSQFTRDMGIDVSALAGVVGGTGGDGAGAGSVAVAPQPDQRPETQDVMEAGTAASDGQRVGASQPTAPSQLPPPMSLQHTGLDSIGASALAAGLGGLSSSSASLSALSAVDVLNGSTTSAGDLVFQFNARAAADTRSAAGASTARDHDGASSTWYTDDYTDTDGDGDGMSGSDGYSLTETTRSMATSNRSRRRGARGATGGAAAHALHRTGGPVIRVAGAAGLTGLTPARAEALIKQVTGGADVMVPPARPAIGAGSTIAASGAGSTGVHLRLPAANATAPVPVPSLPPPSQGDEGVANVELVTAASDGDEDEEDGSGSARDEDDDDGDDDDDNGFTTTGGETEGSNDGSGDSDEDGDVAYGSNSDESVQWWPQRSWYSGTNRTADGAAAGAAPPPHRKHKTGRHRAASERSSRGINTPVANDRRKKPGKARGDGGGGSGGKKKKKKKGGSGVSESASATAAPGSGDVMPADDAPAPPMSPRTAYSMAIAEAETAAAAAQADARERMRQARELVTLIGPRVFTQTHLFKHSFLYPRTRDFKDEQHQHQSPDGAASHHAAEYGIGADAASSPPSNTDRRPVVRFAPTPHSSLQTSFARNSSVDSPAGSSITDGARTPALPYGGGSGTTTALQAPFARLQFVDSIVSSNATTPKLRGHANPSLPASLSLGYPPVPSHLSLPALIDPVRVVEAAIETRTPLGPDCVFVPANDLVTAATVDGMGPVGTAAGAAVSSFNQPQAGADSDASGGGVGGDDSQRRNGVLSRQSSFGSTTGSGGQQSSNAPTLRALARMAVFGEEQVHAGLMVTCGGHGILLPSPEVDKHDPFAAITAADIGAGSGFFGGGRRRGEWSWHHSIGHSPIPMPGWTTGLGAACSRSGYKSARAGLAVPHYRPRDRSLCYFEFVIESQDSLMTAVQQRQQKASNDRSTSVEAGSAPLSPTAAAASGGSGSSRVGGISAALSTPTAWEASHPAVSPSPSPQPPIHVCLGLSARSVPLEGALGSLPLSISLTSSGHVVCGGQWSPVHSGAPLPSYWRDPAASAPPASFRAGDTVGLLLRWLGHSGPWAPDTWPGDHDPGQQQAAASPAHGAHHHNHHHHHHHHQSHHHGPPFDALQLTFSVNGRVVGVSGMMSVPRGTELYPTVSIHTPGVRVVGAFSAADLVHGSRKTMVIAQPQGGGHAAGGPSFHDHPGSFYSSGTYLAGTQGYAVFALDGSMLLSHHD